MHRVSCFRIFRNHLRFSRLTVIMFGPEEIVLVRQVLFLGHGRNVILQN